MIALLLLTLLQHHAGTEQQDHVETDDAEDKGEGEGKDLVGELADGAHATGSEGGSDGVGADGVCLELASDAVRPAAAVELKRRMRQSATDGAQWRGRRDR